MKNLLNQFHEYFQQSDDFKQQIVNYQRMLKTKEWRTHYDLLMTIKGIMANDMFSRKYTSLDAQEKDVVQKTYYNINQILDFLLNPVKGIEKQGKWATFSSQLNRLKDKGKPNQKGKEEKNGKGNRKPDIR